MYYSFIISLDIENVSSTFKLHPFAGRTREREINSRQRALFRKTRKNILVRAKREKRKRDKNADTFCPL